MSNALRDRRQIGQSGRNLAPLRATLKRQGGREDFLVPAAARMRLQLLTPKARASIAREIVAAGHLVMIARALAIASGRSA